MMDPQSNFKTNHGQFPTELLLSIFIYIDGLTLTSCKQVCRHWSQVITHYDDLIWSNACHRDFEPKSRRFWSLQFPPPVRKRQWQDMYRITKNWYNGYAKGNYITVKPTSDLEACTVIGTPQEQGLYTTLTLAHDGRVIRSNPNYNSRIQQHQQQQQRQQRQSLMVQSPLSPQQKFFLDASSNHLARWTADDATNSLSIVCHYTDPSSKWLVTGGLNGAVSVWDLETKTLVRVWHGHRGRVLCINMNNEVVVSGGSDSMIRVWDLDKGSDVHARKSRRRGMIDISVYLSGRSDWYQGVGEIAVNGHLVACAPDASGPILVFSLLTGSLVYELRIPEDPLPVNGSEWMAEEMTAFTHLRLTPFFLLTKGKVHNNNKSIKLVPSTHNIVMQRRQERKQAGYIAHSDDYTVSAPPQAVAQMTPYQLYQYYQTVNASREEPPAMVPESSACIHVWDLQTGKIAYSLVPTLEKPYQHYTITDVRVTPDYSKVFASIEMRGQREYGETLYCWDFASRSTDEVSKDEFDIVQLDDVDSDLRKLGRSWVCFM